MNTPSDIFDKIKIGEALLISFFTDGQVGERYACKLIGHNSGKSLICSPPMRDGHALFVRDGQAIAVRMVSGMNALAFNSRILKSNSLPYPYMHVATPNHVEKTPVRSAIRTKVQLPGTAKLLNVTDKNSVSSEPQITIENLSENGAGFVCDQKFGNNGDEIIIKADVIISAIPKTLELPGIIRNINCETETESDDPPLYSYGIQLVIKNKTEQLFLNAYINQNIVEILYA